MRRQIFPKLIYSSYNKFLNNSVTKSLYYPPPKNQSSSSYLRIYVFFPISTVLSGTTKPLGIWELKYFFIFVLNYAIRLASVS